MHVSRLLVASWLSGIATHLCREQWVILVIGKLPPYSNDLVLISPRDSFFGDRFNLTVTKDLALKNEIVGNATSSDGANWIEMITGCYAGLPAKCPRTLWNFAFAGADIDPAILTLHHDYTVDMTEQVDQWVQAWKSKLLKAPAKSSLAAFFIGINDTGDVSGWKNITDWTAFWNTEMDSYFKAVDQVYNTGLRSFLFLNVPNRIGTNPQIATFNSLLKERIEIFKASKKDVTTIFFDTNKLFADVLANAAAYGFTNTTGYCQCTDPGYFWYNSGHVTEPVHRLIANGVLDALQKAK
ncbi:unnamed protein product [Rhizoctonia solani]|uniref:Lysophospholipase A n=1 Tax=Rhizoctonia solani TaxID=456999 RepID=A0A8H3A7A1_9AGAM|nr:unnamed protein product [Rhizoctonia solani]CAE6532383.1 unnamed protein product [Rhizoctonia solani]